MSKYMKQLGFVSLIAMLSFSTAPLWAADAAPPAGDALVSGSIELTPLDVDPAADRGGINTIIIEGGDCSDDACTSIIGPSNSCEDCNGASGPAASNWMTTANLTHADGMTQCAYGGGVLSECGGFTCVTDAAGVHCKDCGGTGCFWVSSYCS
jgi:hypothetical protein